MPSSTIVSLLDALENGFDVVSDAEIRIETNPGTLSLTYLRELSDVWINRLSLGMQSANVQELTLLERQHSFADVIDSVRWARKAGYDNLNIKIIFGLPDQLIEDWNVSLSGAAIKTGANINICPNDRSRHSDAWMGMPSPDFST